MKYVTIMDEKLYVWKFSSLEDLQRNLEKVEHYCTSSKLLWQMIPLPSALGQI